MTHKEMDIRHRKRQLENCIEELKLMNDDLLVVKSESVKESIRYNITQMKNRKEHLEFKVWQLTK